VSHHYLGIDLGTQGLSVILADATLRIVAAGAGRYDMIPGLSAECYEQAPADWERALVAALAELRDAAGQRGIDIAVAAIGISAQMHGEVLCAADGTALAPARLWCDARNESEGTELTTRFGVKMPKRITAARWLWTLRHRPELARRTARLATPAAWLARQLTGRWHTGIGDAAGMFPIDQATLDYDARLLADFERLAATVPGGPFPALGGILPTVRRAGEDAGALDAHGAALLGLPEGIPVAPAEGDQPASLAGGLIGSAGQVSMSFGTSVVVNAVGDRAFRGVSRAVDHFCAPDGKPINMVWIRNGTTAMNMVVTLFGRAAGEAGAGAFATLMPEVVAAPDDCGGLLALPFMDDEPGVGVRRGGTAMVIGLDEHNATPANVVKAMLLATVFNLREGCDVLAEQGFPRTEIVLSGGLTKTPRLGQVIADAFDTPVTILEDATEGCAWGAALLAAYRVATIGGERRDWASFLAAHATGTPTRFSPRPEGVAELAATRARYRRLLAAQPSLDSAVTAAG